MSNSYEVAGRNAVVTGATKGIGRATAELLAGNGARVIVHGRDAGACGEIAAALPEARGVTADLSSDPERVMLCDTIADHFQGRVDILVHNAGAFPEGSMDSQSLEEWQYVQRVNLESNFHLTKLLLPCLRESGDASVILVSSVVTKFGRGDSPTYTASKAGQIGLGRHMAAELGVDHVRVNLVLPGMVDTEGTRRVNTDERYAEFANELQMIPHPIQPQDLAETIVFLCTPAARAITGASIDVNGGLRV